MYFYISTIMEFYYNNTFHNEILSESKPPGPKPSIDH